MRKESVFVLAVVSAVCVIGPPTLMADWYDSFYDGDFGPGEDPNIFDIDDPCWVFYEPLGHPWDVTVEDGWVRLWTTWGGFLPIAIVTGTPSTWNFDPNTSPDYWDDATPHYIVARAKNTNEESDPNRGRCLLFLNSDHYTWLGYEFQYGFKDIGGQALIGIALVNGIDWKNARLDHINHLDEQDGFWMAFQWETDGVLNDPNGKWLRAVCWNGGKFDWDGNWMLSCNLGEPNTLHDPNASCDPNKYPSKGSTAIGTWTDNIWEAGFPADVAFDEIEARTGAFTNVSRALTLKMKDCCELTVDPDLFDDPNEAYTDPNHIGDPNYYDPPVDASVLRRYTNGTALALGAVVPCGNKTFKKWTIKGPNQSDDPLYQIVTDANEVLYLTMDGDYLVKASCKCGGGGIEPFAGMALLVLGVGFVLRRLS